MQSCTDHVSVAPDARTQKAGTGGAEHANLKIRLHTLSFQTIHLSPDTIGAFRTLMMRASSFSRAALQPCAGAGSRVCPTPSSAGFCSPNRYVLPHQVLQPLQYCLVGTGESTRFVLAFHVSMPAELLGVHRLDEHKQLSALSAILRRLAQIDLDDVAANPGPRFKIYLCRV